MQLTAKLVQVLPLQTGTGKNGQWKKQDIIVETDGQYPKKICISIWGDKIDEKQLQTNNILKIDFDVESREFNGKWYTDVKAWKVEPANAAPAKSSNTSANTSNKPEEGNMEDVPDSAYEDLPF
jgi:hypothetical protein